MILPDHQIAELCQQGMVTPFHPEMINPASLDVRLGDSLLIESAESRELKPYPFHKHHELDPYLLQPGQFVLAPTMETFNLPDHIAAQFVLKSSRARDRLNHLTAGFCDPGWNGSVLTMELHNVSQLHAYPLWPSKRIGQMVFQLMAAPPQRSYRETGRYNGDTTVQGSKG
jgi:dCTP deaminase